MGKYRVFAANWYANPSNTVPISMPRAKQTVAWVDSESEARDRCRAYNFKNGVRINRKFGRAYEYEEC